MAKNSATTKTTDTAGGMSFSDWKKAKCKVSRSIPSVPALSIPEGGAAIVKVMPPVRPPPPKTTNHHFRGPPPVNCKPNEQSKSLMNSTFTSGCTESNTGWQQQHQHQHQQKPRHFNPFCNDMMFPIQQIPRTSYTSRPNKQQMRSQPRSHYPQQKPKASPSSTSQSRPQHPQQKPKVSPSPVKQQPQQPISMPSSQMLLMPPPPPPPPPEVAPQQANPQSQAPPTSAATQASTAGTKSKPKKFTTPWRPMPKMPPPIIATTPESREEKQRLWRQYRQAMKPFKNHEFLNAKRVIQRMGKMNAEELDEKNLGRLLRAQEIVAMHKQRISEKATDCWVRAVNEEMQNSSNTNEEAQTDAGAASTTKTPAQIYFRKTAPNWKKPPYVPPKTYGSGRFPANPIQPPLQASADFGNNVSISNTEPNVPKPTTAYGGRFILGGTLLSGGTTVEAPASISYYS